MEKRVVHIEDFFTEKYEKEGIWFEPKIRGISCGIQFLVTGVGTDENIANEERFSKTRDELEEMKDPVEKVKMLKKLDAQCIASFVKGIKAAEGCETDFGGKPLEYSAPFIEDLFYNAPLIKLEVAKFARDKANFIKGKKNS